MGVSDYYQDSYHFRYSGVHLVFGGFSGHGIYGNAGSFLSHFRRVYLVLEVFQTKSGALLLVPCSHENAVAHTLAPLREHLCAPCTRKPPNGPSKEPSGNQTKFLEALSGVGVFRVPLPCRP